MVVLYKNFGKTAQDTLKDDYDFSRKLKIKSTASNGVTFTTEGEMASNKIISAKLSGAYTHPATRLQFKKLQVTTQGKLITEAELPDAYFKGLKMIFKSEDATFAKNAANNKRTGSLGFEFVQKCCSGDLTFDFGTNNLRKSFAYGYQNFLIGGEANCNLEKKCMLDHSFGVSYAKSDFAVTLQSKKKCNSLSGSFHHRLSKDTVYSAVMDYDLKSGANHLTVGGRYQADAITTYGGKVESDGHVSLVLVQKIRPFLSLTTSAHIDAKNFDSDAHKFGIGLTLG